MQQEQHRNALEAQQIFKKTFERTFMSTSEHKNSWSTVYLLEPAHLRKKAVFEKKRQQKHKETKQNTTLKSRWNIREKCNLNGNNF